MDCICNKCGKLLNSNDIIYLKLSGTNQQYYKPQDLPTNHKSIGVFYFDIKHGMKMLKRKDKYVAYKKIRSLIDVSKSYSDENSYKKL